MTRKIIHIDMDAFFASVEQRDNSDLRGKPVAVGGSAARGVVAAASYEARAYGVHSAMPSVIAARKCPHLIFVKSRFETYKEVSQQIQNIFAEFTPLIEPLSLDEAYLDVTDQLQPGQLASDTAKEIRARILAETGLTASAGVSYNKFLAKIASDQRKPNGQFVIPPEKAEAFIAGLRVKKFYGVGPATAAKMERLGLLTGHDLKQQTLPFLQQHFGKFGAHLFNLARGIDDRPVRPDRIRKSIGAEKTFSEDIHTLDEAKDKLTAIIDKAVTACAQKSLSCRTVTLKVKYADFESITRRCTLANPSNHPTAITRAAHNLLHPIFPPPKGIRLLGVSLSNFGDARAVEAQMILKI